MEFISWTYDKAKNAQEKLSEKKQGKDRKNEQKTEVQEVLTPLKTILRRGLGGNWVPLGLPGE